MSDLVGMKHHQRTIGKTDDWLTPPEIFNTLGPFDLDPACPELEQGKTLPWPLAQINITPSVDGLNGFRWEPSDRVWLNPPFNRRERPKWMRKMAEHGNGIMLIPAATETAAFFEYVWNKADAVCFVRGRPHFHYVDGTRSRANCGCSIALVAYGKENAGILERAGLGKTVRLNK